MRQPFFDLKQIKMADKMTKQKNQIVFISEGIFWGTGNRFIAPGSNTVTLLNSKMKGRRNALEPVHYI